MVLVLGQDGIALQSQIGVTGCFDQPSAHVELIGAQIQNGIIQFTRHLQRVPMGTSGQDGVQVLWQCGFGGMHGQCCGAFGAVDGHVDILVCDGVGADHPLQRAQCHPLTDG